MRSVLRTVAVAATAALTVAGLTPAGAVDPAVPLSKAGPVSGWGTPARPDLDDLGAAPILAIPDTLKERAVRAIDGNQAFAVAVTGDGRVAAWGNEDATAYGAVPAPAGLRDVVDVGAGTFSAVALTADGRLTAWGLETSGLTDIPGSIQGQVKAIEVRSNYAMALTEDGRIVQWGNTAGQSGYAVPSDIQGRVVDMSISASAGVTPGKAGDPNLALLDDGTVRPWGNPARPEDAAAWEVPADIQGDVAKVVSGYSPGVILKDGTIRFWHPVAPYSEYFTELPDGLAEERVVDLETSNSGAYALALSEDGDVYLWGQHTHDADMEPSTTGPVRTGVSAIALGEAMYVLVATTGLAIGSDPVVAGTPRVGQTLTGTPGTFSGTPGSTSSRWLADGVEIDAAGTRLTLTTAHVGKRITYATTAVSEGATLTAISAATPRVVRPPSSTPPPPATPSKVASKTDVQKVKVKKRGKKVIVKVRVTAAAGVRPTGAVKVVVKRGSKKVAAKNAKVNTKGLAKLTAKRLKPGRYKVKASYTGSTRVTGSKDNSRFRI